MRSSSPYQSSRAVTTVNASPGTFRQPLKQPTFNWKVADKYSELINFEMELNNIFMTKNDYTEDSEKVLIVINRLGHGGLHFVKY